MVACRGRAGAEPAALGLGLDDFFDADLVLDEQRNLPVKISDVRLHRLVLADALDDLRAHLRELHLVVVVAAAVVQQVRIHTYGLERHMVSPQQRLVVRTCAPSAEQALHAHNVGHMREIAA